MTDDNSPDELRSLWQSQTVAPFEISPDKLRLKMKQMDRFLLRRDRFVYVTFVGTTLWFSYWILLSSTPKAMRIGFILCILGVGFCAAQIWLDRNSRRAYRTMATASGNDNSVDFLRVQLERQRDFHRGAWFWSRLIALHPGLLVCGIWGIIAAPKSPFGYTVTAAILIINALAIHLNRKKSLSYQRQIDALDALKPGLNDTRS